MIHDSKSPSGGLAHSTLIGADDQPAELVGHGPIPAGLAREIAADAVWRRLVTDPLSGTVLDYGRTTYHPPAALADHVRVRDVYCRFPGCRRRAADAELDHVVAWRTAATRVRRTSARAAPTTTDSNTTPAGASRGTPTAG